jgi:hypothetical protein
MTVGKGLKVPCTQMTAVGVLVTDAHTHREYDAHATLSHVFTQLRAKNALLEERARQQGEHFLRVGLFCPAMSSTMADALGSVPGARVCTMSPVRSPTSSSTTYVCGSCSSGGGPSSRTGRGFGRRTHS